MKQASSGVVESSGRKGKQKAPACVGGCVGGVGGSTVIVSSRSRLAALWSMSEIGIATWVLVSSPNTTLLLRSTL